MLLRGGVRRGTRLAFRSLLFTVVPPGYVWLTLRAVSGRYDDMFNY